MGTIVSASTKACLFSVDSVEFVEDSIQSAALDARVWWMVPEFHLRILFEDVFDDKPFSQ